MILFPLLRKFCIYEPGSFGLESWRCFKGFGERFDKPSAKWDQHATLSDPNSSYLQNIQTLKLEQGMNSQSHIVDSSQANLTGANIALNLTVRLLFVVAVIGQLMFVYHIVSFYGGTAVQGEWEQWNTVLYNGLIEGDWVGNFFLGLHVFLAAIITFGGPLQFIPQIRTQLPSLHRWNGRIYLLTAFVISFAGLYMIFTRGVIGGTVMKMGNTLNALLIMIFALMAWRTALARDFVAHRRWALRTFLMVSGVWFFRIGFGLWIFLNNGTAPGSTEELGGPFDMFLAFAHSLLPLAILELYLHTKDHAGKLGRFALSAGLLVLAGALGAGIFMAAMIFWLPHF